VIVAKHRNGPVGTRRLVFLPQFPKFHNHTGQQQPIEQPAGERIEEAAAEGPAF
jgi:hypothetical protein